MVSLKNIVKRSTEITLRAALICLLLTASRTRAESDANVCPGVSAEEAKLAKADLAKAKEFFDAGAYTNALEKFKDAFEACGNQSIWYNIATTADKLGYFQEALSAYQNFLSTLPPESRDSSMQKAISNARLRVNVLKPLVAQINSGNTTQGANKTATVSAKKEKRNAHNPNLWHIGPALLAGSGLALVITAIAAREDGCAKSDVSGCLIPKETDMKRVVPVAVIGASALVGAGIWWGIGLKNRKEKPVDVSLSPTSVRLRMRF